MRAAALPLAIPEMVAAFIFSLQPPPERSSILQRR
jgi:hypothetical protein